MVSRLATNPEDYEGSDPCVHPHTMKTSPAGELAMGVRITALLQCHTHAGSLPLQTLVGTLTLRCRVTDKGWNLSTQLPLPPPCVVHPVLVHMDDDAHNLLPWMPATHAHADAHNFATMDACTTFSCRCLYPVGFRLSPHLVCLIPLYSALG